MAISKLSILNNPVANLEKSREPTLSFAQVFAQKKAATQAVVPGHEIVSNVSMGGINKILGHMVSNHESATAAMRSSLVRTNYTPEKLLNMQYETGMLLLREQMYAKTVELSANTLKNFTQMQV